MELRQLEYFVAVAEEANFTRAAERIHVAQPAVSAQIQRLERELGQPLLDRSRRAVRLTAAGEAALPYARAALAAVADMHVAVDELTQLVRGTVTIGTVTSHSVDIPSLLADFHAEHPNVEITLGTDSSDALIEKVRTGRLDAAIVSVGPDERPEGLDVEVVTDEAIARRGMPDRRAREAEDHPAGRPGATGRSSRCPSGRASGISSTPPAPEPGVTPRIAFEASTPLALADLAERGLGVAIVPASVPRGRDGLHALAIVPELRGRLVLAWRSGGPISPAARVLIDRARRLLRVSGGA